MLSTSLRRCSLLTSRATLYRPRSHPSTRLYQSYKSVNPLYAHEEHNPYADYSQEPPSYTLAWKILVFTAGVVFVFDNTFDLTRPTQTHLTVWGHGSPM